MSAQKVKSFGPKPLKMFQFFSEIVWNAAVWHLILTVKWLVLCCVLGLMSCAKAKERKVAPKKEDIYSIIFNSSYLIIPKPQ